MAKVPSAGELRERMSFQARSTVDDGFGGQVPGGAFATSFTVWARLMPLHGGEGVLAGRLQGTQPYVITVRASSQTRQIDESWQVVDARDASRVFSIAAPPTDPYDQRGAFIDLLVVQGGGS